MNQFLVALLLTIVSAGAIAQQKCHVRIVLLASSQTEVERASPEIRDKTCAEAIASSALRFDDQARPITFFRQGTVTWGKEGENDVMEIRSLDGSFRYVGKSTNEYNTFKFEGVDKTINAIGKLEVKKMPDGKVGEFLYSYTARRFGLVHYKPGD